MITVTRMIGIVTIITQISWSCNIVLYYQSYSIVLCASKAQRYKMVIELSGVQVELKSYAWSAWLQNGTSAQHEFDLKSQVWFQAKVTRHKSNHHFITFYFEITIFKRQNWYRT